VGTYDLAPGFEPGAYGKKQTVLESKGNVLPFYFAEIMLDKGIIVEAAVSTPAPKKKKAKAKESN